MKKFLFRLVQCTWGIPQTLIGLIIFLSLGKKECVTFHGAYISRWNYPYSVSLGMFIFISRKTPCFSRLAVHEYGHCIQSLFLGIFYLPLVSVPSALWLRLPVCRKRRLKRDISYYSFITERTADWLGEFVCRK
ncbi:MAG: hypothetical protein IJY74_06025 [Oscillospiraceae bacterium]|nr:hypothetical protein [Oscillospiraceae bacterium]